MINIVDDMLAKHSDAEITEHLYRKMQTIYKWYQAACSDGGDEVLLLTRMTDVEEVTEILRALHKRNQERQAQAEMA